MSNRNDFTFVCTEEFYNKYKDTVVWPSLFKNDENIKKLDGHIAITYSYIKWSTAIPEVAQLVELLSMIEDWNFTGYAALVIDTETFHIESWGDCEAMGLYTEPVIKFRNESLT